AGRAPGGRYPASPDHREEHHAHGAGPVLVRGLHGREQDPDPGGGRADLQRAGQGGQHAQREGKAALARRASRAGSDRRSRGSLEEGDRDPLPGPADRPLRAGV
ncbi:MAG: LSU ribosomal protein L23p (L23Ae), partial [uncultured Thermomicrobiales bacterium]